MVFDGGQLEKIESKVLVPPVNMSCDNEDRISPTSVNVKGRFGSWIVSIINGKCTDVPFSVKVGTEE